MKRLLNHILTRKNIRDEWQLRRLGGRRKHVGDRKRNVEKRKRDGVEKKSIE
jgi:hypothetical protein